MRRRLRKLLADAAKRPHNVEEKRLKNGVKDKDKSMKSIENDKKKKLREDAKKEKQLIIRLFPSATIKKSTHGTRTMQTTKLTVLKMISSTTGMVGNHTDSTPRTKQSISNRTF